MSHRFPYSRGVKIFGHTDPASSSTSNTLIATNSPFVFDHDETSSHLFRQQYKVCAFLLPSI